MKRIEKTSAIEMKTKKLWKRQVWITWTLSIIVVDVLP